jgi:hypothetical protein
MPLRIKVGPKLLARAAREARKDQYQVIEILGFQAWETGENRW